jgi:hypothetical protein
MNKNDHTDLLLNLFFMSITAHNVQPFKLKNLGKNHFEVWAQACRFLPVADPHFRDLEMGLGALIETFEIGLSASKIRLIDLNLHSIPTHINSELVKLASFSLVVDDSLTTDPLAQELNKRFSYRAKFIQSISIEKNETCGKGVSLIFLTSKKDKEDVGIVFDKVNYKFLCLPGYIDELYSWMRFNKNHKRWTYDGLNTESMGLNRVESFGASIVLRPFFFKILKILKLMPHLIVEQPIIESSSAVVAITGPSLSPFEMGRGFMRGWLQLTALNLYGAPLSLLTDDIDSMKAMRVQFKLGKDENIYNILRVGPLPTGYNIPARARLAKEDLSL